MWMRTHNIANCPMVYNNRLITTSGTVSISMQSTYIRTYVCTTGNVRTIACEWRLWDFSAAAMSVTFWKRQTCIVLCCMYYSICCMHYSICCMHYSIKVLMRLLPTATMHTSHLPETTGRQDAWFTHSASGGVRWHGIMANTKGIKTFRVYRKWT